MFSGVKATKVTSITPGLINKTSYVVKSASITGVSMKMTFTQEKMKELLKNCGMTEVKDLMGKTVISNSKGQFMILPEEAELVIAARCADGKLIELDFQGT